MTPGGLRRKLGDVITKITGAIPLHEGKNERQGLLLVTEKVVPEGEHLDVGEGWAGTYFQY